MYFGTKTRDMLMTTEKATLVPRADCSLDGGTWHEEKVPLQLARFLDFHYQR